jgi:hypothetical protein
MPDPLDPMKDLHRNEFLKGQEAVAGERAAQDAKERLEQTKEVLRLASDTIDFANEMAKDGDPHKTLLANLIKDRVAGVAEQVVNGKANEAASVAEGRGALEVSPLFDSSGNSGHSETRLPEPEAKALTQQPQKPKRGRPRGSKSRPKSS